VHGCCGDLLHAANPFGKGIDYDFYHQQCFIKWFNLVIALLNFHQVHLLNKPRFWFIQMGDFSTDHVSYNIFSRVTGQL
jgi:hypothetical protein